MPEHDSPQALTTADLAEATHELDRRFTESMSRKDLDAAMACFWDDPDVVVALNGDVHRGPDAVRAAIKEMFDQHESVRLEVNEVTHHATTTAASASPRAEPRRTWYRAT